MKVRILKPLRPLGNYPVGYILDVTPGMADVWLKRGMVEIVDESSPVECAAIEPDSNAALHTTAPPKRKRGRPRKHPLPT